MKNKISLIFILIIILFAAYTFFPLQFTEHGKKNISNVNSVVLQDELYSLLPSENNPQYSYGEVNEYNRMEGESERERDNEKKEGPEYIKEYFESMHYPYGSILPQDKLVEIHNELGALQTEQTMDMPVNSWVCVGPFGYSRYSNPTFKYTGRITDIEFHSFSGIRFAAASGGLWGYAGITPVPLSDKVNTLNIGAFATNPNNANEIFLGTGEPWINSGTGLWRTTDAGNSWTNIPMSPNPLSFFKIKYTPGNVNIIHIASGQNYQRSTNGGLTWIAYLSGVISDVVIKPSNTNILYAGKHDGGSGIGGVYKSTTGGTTWNRIFVSPLPAVNVGRIALSISASNPNVVYANIARQDNNLTLGIFKTTNDGVSWQDISWRDGSGNIIDFHWGQGWYNNTIGVSPVNQNLVIAGGGGFLRSTNGGTNWLTLVGYPDYHPDLHDVEWNSGGSMVYVANDGGFHSSSDGGANWITNYNNAPITQFYGVSTPKNERGVITGGTQDNLAPMTFNSGVNWVLPPGVRDCSGSAVNAGNTNEIYYTGFLGITDRYKTTNSGANYVDFNTGIPAGDFMWGNIRQDIVPQVILYTNQGQYVYRSIFPYNNWTQLNATAFPNDVGWIDVSRFNGTTVVYASLSPNPPNATNKLRVHDGGTWYERSAGLPSGANVRSIGQHPINNSIAYSVMTGLSTPGQKIYKTTNRGTSWVNISGNIPNIPLTSLVPHPTNSNLLFLSSEYGCYKTTNNGVNWIRWNNGMHDNILVTEMTYIDSTAINGKFYAVAGTYGRGIYIRDVTGDDPVTGIISLNLPALFSLGQNYPNPFNPNTNIEFTLPVRSNVRIIVYDVKGREVSVLLDENKGEGKHSVVFRGENYSSGVYFYKIITERFTDVKKMLLVK